MRLDATSAAADEALLAFGSDVPSGALLTLNLSPGGDLAEAAANLFAMLRALDRPDVGRIAVMSIPQTGLGLAINDRLRRAATDDGTGRQRLGSRKREETMPDTVIPLIPTIPVTPSVLDALRAIVGDKGLILDDQGKQPFVTDWKRLDSRHRRRRGASGQHRGSRQGRKALLRQRHRHRAAGRQHRPDGRRHAVADPQRHRAVARPHEPRASSVDPVGYSMTVEAGCILQTLQETAAAMTVSFRSAWAPQGSCMIGGNLSTNAGGVQVLRYGNARNLVMGLEVVLPNGDMWNGLRSLKKDNTGYDLKHLFMGAEGTLGIITKAVLKLWPAPKDVATAWLAIRDPQAAIELLSEAHSASEDNVGSCELMSRAATDMVLRAHSRRAGSAQGRHAMVPAARMVVVAAQDRRRGRHVGEDGAVPRPTRWRPAACSMR